jgi:hypothetical protein
MNNSDDDAVFDSDKKTEVVAILYEVRHSLTTLFEELLHNCAVPLVSHTPNVLSSLSLSLLPRARSDIGRERAGEGRSAS